MGVETPPLRAEKESPVRSPARPSEPDESGVSNKELGVELVQALKSMPEVLRESLQGIARPDDTAQANDKLNAIAGFKFEQSLPVIEDSDYDFERHVREFQSVLDCYSFGRRGVRPYDQLTIFRKTRPDGSVRLKVYDTAIKRARKADKLPPRC